MVFSSLYTYYKEENVTDANAKASGAFETNLPGQINAISDVADKL